MKQGVINLLRNKNRPVPILASPAAAMMGISVSQLIESADLQAQGMAEIAKRFKPGAVLSAMDLSVEAEAFGCTVRKSDSEVPTVEKGVIEDIFAADSIAVPEIGAGRTKIYIEGIQKAKQIIIDRPIYCGAIGPYSLAGRVFDMTELMMECYDSSDEVKTLLEKCTEFIIKYITALKKAGADGVILAEPAAGLLSPEMCDEFSCAYIKEIVAATADESFVFCYHNCGNTVTASADRIAAIGADVFHFGNVINLKDIIPLMPAESIVMGNVDPLLFRDGTPEKIEGSCHRIYDECKEFDNFMLSSGCDIPATAKTENIEAFFNCVNKLYE